MTLLPVRYSEDGLLNNYYLLEMLKFVLTKSGQSEKLWSGKQYQAIGIKYLETR